MSADTMTKDEGLRLMQAEIERLRDFIRRDWPYDAGPLEVVAARDAEIERLRGLLRETLEDGYIRVPYGASHEDVSAILDFEKRIREAI